MTELHYDFLERPKTALFDGAGAVTPVEAPSASVEPTETTDAPEVEEVVAVETNTPDAETDATEANGSENTDIVESELDDDSSDVENAPEELLPEDPIVVDDGAELPVVSEESPEESLPEDHIVIDDGAELPDVSEEMPEEVLPEDPIVIDDGAELPDVSEEMPEEVLPEDPIVIDDGAQPQDVTEDDQALESESIIVEEVEEVTEDEAIEVSDDSDNVLVIIDTSVEGSEDLIDLETNATVVIIDQTTTAQQLADKIKSVKDSDEAGEFSGLEIYSHNLSLGAEKLQR